MLSKSLPFKIILFESLDSTHTFCCEKVKAGTIGHCDIVQTKEQTAGVGQHNRKWENCKGDQLYLSMVIDPKRAITQEGGQEHSFREFQAKDLGNQIRYEQLSYIVSVAAGEAIASLKGDADISYKWINDVMLEGKKAGGVLASLMSEGAGGDREKLYAILSLGMNIQASPKADKNYAGNSIKNFGAISLKEAEIETTSSQYRDAFLISFANLYNEWLKNGFTHISSKWQERDFMVGRKVSVETGNAGGVVGIYCGMNENGDIEVEDLDKVKHIVSHGKISII